MSVREIVARLRALRMEIEQQGEEPISNIEVPLALAFFDVMNALGLGAEAQIAVLGSHNALHLHEAYGIEWEEMA